MTNAKIPSNTDSVVLDSSSKYLADDIPNTTANTKETTKLEVLRIIDGKYQTAYVDSALSLNIFDAFLAESQNDAPEIAA